MTKITSTNDGDRVLFKMTYKEDDNGQHNDQGLFKTTNKGDDKAHYGDQGLFGMAIYIAK
jgi:hypothetical protein